MWCWKYDIRHSEIKSSEERSDITGNQILPVFQTPVKKPTMFTANWQRCWWKGEEEGVPLLCFTWVLPVTSAQQQFLLLWMSSWLCHPLSACWWGLVSRQPSWGREPHWRHKRYLHLSLSAHCFSPSHSFRGLLRPTCQGQQHSVGWGKAQSLTCKRTRAAGLAKPDRLAVYLP